jgi:ADP-ribose pyrophosphatase
MIQFRSGKHLRLVDHDDWEFVEPVNATGVVAMVAVTDKNEIIFTEQYRPSVRKRVIDLPAGELACDIKGAESEASSYA